MAVEYSILISSFILIFGNVGFTAVRGQISWTPIYVDTSNRLDLWTVESVGCICPDGKSTNCACCVKPGGCLCTSNLNKCAQCGLEDSCQRTCNVTISARTVATRSGLSWIHLQSPELEGPTSCFWKLHSAPGQRIEVQIHRMVSVGSFDNSSQTCKEGWLQFADGDISIPSQQAIQLCGQNSRFSPPVVLFGDQGMATLFLRIEGKSTRSQVLAYVSFSSIDDPTVGDPSRGGKLRPHSVCDWTYDNCWAESQTNCIISSPGYPGLFPPHRRCRYFLTATGNSTSKILIRFQSLSIPPPPLCSSHHIAVWRKNVSNSYLGPPWKVLCQQSESTVVVDDGQALIEFRSGSNTSPYLYTGFRASVEFLHSTAVVVPTAFSPKRTILAVEPSRHQDVEVVVGKKSPPASGSAKSRSNQKKHGEKPSEEPARPISSTDEPKSPLKRQVVTCDHVFDGNVVRDESFRLKIPTKDMSSAGNKKNSKGNAGESVHGNWNSKPSGQFHCLLQFAGKETDVVQLALSNYKLRGSNCSSQIQVYDMLEDGWAPNKTTSDGLSNKTLLKLCGPISNEVQSRFTSSRKRMVISVVMSSKDSPVASEVLEGAFRFHDESAGGTLKSQSTCDVVVSQSSHPSAGSLSVVGPFNSPLLRLANRLPFVCSYSIHPAQNQSVILTLVNTTTGHDTSTNPISEAHHEKHYDSTSSPQCRTVCSTSGCSCDLSKLTQIDQVDHFSIVTGSGGSTEIACFCGSLSNILPIVFESDNPLSLIAHYASGKMVLNHNISYQFTSPRRYNSFSIFPPSGWKRWREILPGQAIMPKGSNSYKIYDLTWPAIIPIRSKLNIDLLSEENEQDCSTWNLTAWAEHDKFPNRTYLLTSFCPAEGRRELKVPESIRNVFIKTNILNHIPMHTDVKAHIWDDS
ncbi:uncharacterized protein LOC110859521 isoform X2 [Folsomia candida]|uniref:uncharacterized protein LOC110859521 isoform X2 n=1 Tax=Folsomia candida TaxID=158441 RepID=UPI0016054C28|nr:uncharacterized protein LOC110859521 isoform X2 [Folsomia candida]